jgi:ATP-GRASP peptide maturase of grasp-with-spasm system
MKKILLLTSNNDQSSSVVIKWLCHFKQSFSRINSGTEINVIRINVKNSKIDFEFSISGKIYHLSDYKSYWYRRGDFTIANAPKYESADKSLEKKVNRYLLEEQDSLHFFIHKVFENRLHIGSNHNASVNKLHVLKLADESGLNIPDTSVLCTKKMLTQLINKNGAIITKGIQEGLILSHQHPDQKESTQYTAYTSAFTKKDLKETNAEFPPTKFQNKIDKAIELRIFYLNGKCYTMAIFSQNNPKTALDFRHYDRQLPNRNTPFVLPKAIEKKLKLLMSKLALNTGSIDMIIDKNGQYVLLEVNPIGQFGMVSGPCNYKLEKKIANFLSHKTNKNEK